MKNTSENRMLRPDVEERPRSQAIELSRLRTQLENRKEISKEDIDTALEFVRAIMNLDHLVFPNDPVVVGIDTRKTETDDIAGYMAPDEDLKDGYAVFISGITTRANKEASKTRGLFRTSTSGKIMLYKDDQRPKITLGQVALAIAAHEVRHRVQTNISEHIYSEGTFRASRRGIRD